MRTTRFTALAGVGFLALAGCGDNGDATADETTEDTSSVDQERIAELEEQLAERDEADQERISDLESQIIDLEEALEASEEQLQPEQDEGEGEGTSDPESSSGETVELGEAASIDEWFTGEHAGYLTLEEIERGYQNPECERWGDTPESGEFVALHFTLEAGDDQVSMWEDDFYLVDDDGNLMRNEIHTSEAWGCSMYAGVLESAPAGTTASGVVLLDTTLDSGTLVYDGGETEVRWDFE